MNDFGFPKRKKKTLDELNVVPILDMFISIVFFLLLSASLIGMTKIVLPPATTSNIEEGSTKIPLNPKLFVINSIKDPGSLRVILKWEGDQAGGDAISLPIDIVGKQIKNIDEIKKIIKKFKALFPNERTIQISLQSGINYQWLISVMDGVREDLPDMVLNSYLNADGIRE